MAKKQVLQIKDFSGGVNSYSDPRDLQENEFQILDNASVDEQGIIRVSGGLELKDNIDLSLDALIQQGDGTFLQVESLIPKSGKGLFSHRTDYVYDFIFEGEFNSSLESSPGGTSSAWGVTDVDGDGTWAFQQVLTNTNEANVGEVGANNYFAINYDDYDAGGNHDHGSLTFNNVSLFENTVYTLRLNIISERPWFYMGSNVPPRVRIYHPTDIFTSY